MTYSSPTITKLTALFATLAFATQVMMPVNAFANETVSVTIDRSELATPEGAKRVYAKLKRTAEKACRVNERVAPISLKIAAKDCAEDMLDGFVKQVNSSRLTALNASTISTPG